MSNKPSAAHKLRKKGSYLALLLSGVKFEVYNREHLPKEDEAVIYCPNHASYLDILVGLSVLPGNFGFVGKEELTKNPFLKMFFGRTDVTVKRGNVMQSAVVLEKSREFLDKGWGIVIFPEGGIRSSAPRISNLKDGAFRLSRDTGKKIVPVTFADNYRLLDLSSFKALPGRCRVFIHEPLTPEENNYDPKQLKEKTFNILSKQINKTVFHED